MSVTFDNPALDVTLVIFGFVLLIISLIGGNIQMLGISFPQISKSIRAIAFVLGFTLILMGFSAGTAPTTPTQGETPVFPQVTSPMSVPYCCDGLGRGICPMAENLPAGSFCTCANAFGAYANGNVCMIP